MKLQLTRFIGGVLTVLALGGILPSCTHVAGIATWQGTSLPAAGAELSVGPPGSTFTMHFYPVNAKGYFNFWISSLDTDNIWVWSGQGHANFDSVQLDASQISDHMAIQVPQRVVPPQ